MIANIEGLIVDVRIFIVDKSNRSFLGIVDDVSKEKVIMAEDHGTAQATQLPLQHGIFFFKLAFRLYQLHKSATINHIICDPGFKSQSVQKFSILLNIMFHALMGRFQLELFYLFFPPSSHSLVVISFL